MRLSITKKCTMIPLCRVSEPKASSLAPYSNRISPAFVTPAWQAKQTALSLCLPQPVTQAGQVLLVYGNLHLHVRIMALPCTIALLQKSGLCVLISFSIEFQICLARSPLFPGSLTRVTRLPHFTSLPPVGCQCHEYSIAWSTTVHKWPSVHSSIQSPGLAIKSILFCQLFTNQIKLSF